MKRLSLILLINCLSLASYAQGDVLNNAKIALNAMFAGLDKGL